MATTIGQLSDDFEIVALVDADTVVDRHWLSDLVAPLNDPGTAVSTGSRWYLPPDTGMGTMVRYLWYVAASVQIYIYKVPWGGSMAVRMDYIRQTDLLKRWSHSLFEDTSITDHTFSHGKKTAIVPGLLMQNSESIDLSGASDWIQRQLFNARLYHGKFPLAIVHCFGSSLVLLAAIAVALGGFLSGAVTSGTMMVLVLIIYLLYYLAILAWLDSRAQDVLKKRNLSQADGAKRVARPTLFWRAVAIMITQCIYLRAMIGAMVQRRIRWRGIQYVAKRPFEIRMVEYRPMVDFETDQIGQPFRSLEL